MLSRLLNPKEINNPKGRRRDRIIKIREKMERGMQINPMSMLVRVKRIKIKSSFHEIYVLETILLTFSLKFGMHSAC